jgi:hypothetical protein
LTKKENIKEREREIKTTAGSNTLELIRRGQKGKIQMGTNKGRLWRATNHARCAPVLGVQFPNQRRKEKDVETAREDNPKDKRQHFGVGDICGGARAGE